MSLVTSYRSLPSSVRMLYLILIPQMLSRIYFHSETVAFVGPVNQYVGLVAEIVLLTLMIKKISWVWKPGLVYSLYLTLFSVYEYTRGQDLAAKVQDQVLSNPALVDLPREQVELMVQSMLNTTLGMLILCNLLLTYLWWRAKFYYQPRQSL